MGKKEEWDEIFHGVTFFAAIELAVALVPIGVKWFSAAELPSILIFRQPPAILAFVLFSSCRSVLFCIYIHPCSMI